MSSHTTAATRYPPIPEVRLSETRGFDPRRFLFSNGGFPPDKGEVPEILGPVSRFRWGAEVSHNGRYCASGSSRAYSLLVAP